MDTAVVSVDFELFSHTPAYRNAAGADTAIPTAALFDSDDGDSPGVRADERTLSAAEDLLAVFDRRGVRSTFFTVSEIATHRQSIVQRIGAAHELASHTHTHRHLSELDPGQCREELCESRATLERRGGVPVTGFRAPSFDIGPPQFAELSSAGYEYDSSVVPARWIPGWYGGEHHATRVGPLADIVGESGLGVTEVPVGVMPGLRLPISGAWLRLLGVNYTIAGMRWLARRDIPPVLYVHPWEFAELPRIEGIPARVYWRTGSWMWDALSTILDQPFEFVTTRTLIERESRADGE